MTGPNPWLVEHHTGSAARFHERPMPEPATRCVWWFSIERAALVLGSGQPDEVVDRAAAARLGFELARRHSGGGAVLLIPGDVTWVDVIIPAGDPLWQHDVGRAFDWLGDVWVATLSELGVEDARSHRGPMVRTQWSDIICFAGLGRGEIVVSGRKVLGISQRRTRRGARFQCALLHRWNPAPLIDALALEPLERARALAEVADGATGLADAGVSSDGAKHLEAAFFGHLPT